jgi:hypothetical protein
MLFAGTALAAPSWSAPTQVGWNGTWNDGDPAIAADSGGTLHAVFDSDNFEGTGNTNFDSSNEWQAVYYTQSGNGGTTWSAPVRVSGEYDAERATIAVNSNDTVCIFFARQNAYYTANYRAYNFDVTKARFNYVTCSTNGGTSFPTATKLPSQRTTTTCNNSGTGLGCAARGDYLWATAGGTNLYLTTTDVSSGKIVVWVSTDDGTTWVKKNVGTTKAQDLTPAVDPNTGAYGYVGGFSGLPAIGANAAGIGVEWTAANTGKMVATICASDATGCVQQQLQRSGAKANGGYAQATGADHRLAFTWTTANGAFLRLYDTTAAAWGTKTTINSFPDTDPAVGTQQNKGGEGVIPLLKAGTTTVGVITPECNAPGGNPCDYSAGQDREQLVYRESTDGGATFGAASIVAAPSTAKKTYINDFGWAIYSGGQPLVFWNGHNAAYDPFSAYVMNVSTCTGCA